MIRQHPDLAFAAVVIVCILTAAICARLGLTWADTLMAIGTLLTLAVIIGAAVRVLR